jgi:hypothetical protein
MVLRQPRAERQKKKSTKSGGSPRSSPKSDYKNSSGSAGPIPYALLMIGSHA